VNTADVEEQKAANVQIASQVTGSISNMVSGTNTDSQAATT
jgi:hypothetical protein